MSRKLIVMLLTWRVFSLELQCILEEVQYRTCITLPPSSFPVKAPIFQLWYVMLTSVGRNMCVHSPLLKHMQFLNYLSMSKDFLLSWCRHTCCGWVPRGPELKQFCVRMLSAAKRQHGGKAGKEEYLQTVPTPSVKESKTENRSLFITCLWISLLRGQAGRMENIFTIIFGLHVLHVMCCIHCQNNELY